MRTQDNAHLNVVLGASGQVGSAVVDCLLKENAPVKAVVHSADKVEEWEKKGVPAAAADAFDLTALRTAFSDGGAVFVLTPETGRSNDVIGDTKTILANYRAAITASPVKKVVGLSSIGAQYAVGNLEMSYLLERAFDNLNVQRIFVRPAYYYSNWLPFLSAAKERGVLPTFYPVDLKIPMSSPLDVAAFMADLLVTKIEGSPVYELEGPESYSSNDVADAMSEALGRDVKAERTPREKWDDQLRQIGYTEDAIKNFVAMTELVAAGQTHPEGQGMIRAKTKTTLQQYLSEVANTKRA